MGRKKLPSAELSKDILKKFKKAMIDDDLNMKKFCESNNLRYGSFRVSLSKSGKMQLKHAEAILKYLGLNNTKRRTHKEILEIVKKKIPKKPMEYSKLYTDLINSDYIYLSADIADKDESDNFMQYLSDNCSIDSKTVAGIYDEERRKNIVLLVAPKNKQNKEIMTTCYNNYRDKKNE